MGNHGVTYCFASDMIRFLFGMYHEKLTGISFPVNSQSAFRRQRHYVFRLSVRPSVRSWQLRSNSPKTSVRPKPEIHSFHLYMGPLVHPTNHDHFASCPSVRPSGEVSGHLTENAWREWPEILHADVSCLLSELISLESRSVDFQILTLF